MKIKRNIFNIIIFIIIIIVLAINVYPIFWMVKTSFSKDTRYDKQFEFSTIHYIELFQRHGFSRFILNSILVSTVSTMIVTTISVIAAYTFARFKFKGKDNIALWIISTRFLPPVIIAIPVYVLFVQLRLINNYISLIIIYITMNIPIAVWLLKSYINEVPLEVEESAKVDGCSRIGIIFKIVIPMITPGLIATSILVFIFSWNEYLFSLILTGNTTRTLPVAVSIFQADRLVLWGPLSAGGLISIVPIIVLTAIVHKNLVKGLTLGAIK